MEIYCISADISVTTCCCVALCCVVWCSRQHLLVVMTFPGRPMLFEKDSDHTLRRKFSLGVESELLKQGDVITVKIKESPVGSVIVFFQLE